MTLGRQWTVFNLVRPKRGRVLPEVLSRSEVLRLLAAVRPACCPRCGSAHGYRIGRFLPAALSPASPTRGPPS